MKATGRFGSFSSRTSWNSSSVLSRIWSRPTRTGRPAPPCCQSLCSDSIEERRPWQKRRRRNIWSWRQRAGSSRGSFELRAEETKGWRSVSFEPEKLFTIIIKSCNDLKFGFSNPADTLLWGKLWEGIPCLPSNVLSSCSWFPNNVFHVQNILSTSNNISHSNCYVSLTLWGDWVCESLVPPQMAFLVFRLIPNHPPGHWKDSKTFTTDFPVLVLQSLPNYPKK